MEEEDKTIGRIAIRILIPANSAGNIIGKGGDKIKLLRSNHPGAQIKVREAPPDCPERVVYVECSFDETDAILNTLIADINSNKYGDRKRGNSTELLLLFSDLRVGSIIGSKGSIINKIRKESGCYIKAYMKKLPLSDERIVMCSGDEEKIISAVKSIYEMFPKDETACQHFDPAGSMMMMRDPECGGYAIGVGKSMSRGVGQISGKKRNLPPEMPPPPPFRKSPRSFEDTWGGGPMGMGYEEYNPSPRNSEHMLATFVMQYPFTLYSGSDGDSYVMKEVTLENNLAGCVIGDRGDRINEIRSTCGAKVNIGKNDSASQGERLITIEGTQHQCNLAEYMLKCCVRAFSTVYNSSELPQYKQRKKLLPDERDSYLGSV